MIIRIRIETNEQKKRKYTPKKSLQLCSIPPQILNFFFISFFFFEIGSPCAAQAGLELMILLLLPSECWNYRCVPPHLAILDF
jgi:hypothetical protein